MELTERSEIESQRLPVVKRRRARATVADSTNAIRAITAFVSFLISAVDVAVMVSDVNAISPPTPEPEVQIQTRSSKSPCMPGAQCDVLPVGSPAA